MYPTLTDTPPTRLIALRDLTPSSFSHSIYGDPSEELGDLIESIRAYGVMVPLVVVREGMSWEVVSGHRRLACAQRLDLGEVPCEVRSFPSRAAKERATLEYNRQRRKMFSQLMREADALENLHAEAARRRRLDNLRQNARTDPESRNSDARSGRTDSSVAASLGLGGKDVYRQARAIWKAAQSGDVRAQNALGQLDARTKTIHSAYKDLRRRDRFSAGFRPTPYDVWAFKHDRAFGIPHPGSIPPAIVAHTLHYFTTPNSLVVDPMAGGGTTIDVCESMGRRCLAYDITPMRPEIKNLDVRQGFPLETCGCDLIFCDPPYHTMLARRYARTGVDAAPLSGWVAFLTQLAKDAFATLRPGGFFALLVANQTEKDLPNGFGYLDHAFYGYGAMVAAGFLPERRISCPMDGAYLPQQVRGARAEGRMLGQVRDLVVGRKPLDGRSLGQGFAAGQFVDFAADEGIGESRIASDNRLGERGDGPFH
jgi:ParB-like chromosome segregation protein Spo0J